MAVAIGDFFPIQPFSSFSEDGVQPGVISARRLG
jgi:hypothetical protein